MPKSKAVKAGLEQEPMHRCGACDNEFLSEEIYLAHACVKTGFTPATADHLDATSGGRFSLASAAALKRGEAKAVGTKKKT